MCGRYLVQSDSDIEEINDIINTVQKKIDNMHQISLDEIYPTNIAPVYVENNSGKEAVPMKWGFPRWDNKGVIINARSETAEEKKTFSSALKNSRCVIPATGFYEWNTENGKKIKYLFKNIDSPVLYMAGIYRTFKNGGTDETAFTIFTTAANEYMDIHNRMPVILNKDEIFDYLTNDNFYEILFQRDNIRLSKEKV